MKKRWYVRMHTGPWTTSCKTVIVNAATLGSAMDLATAFHHAKDGVYAFDGEEYTSDMYQHMRGDFPEIQ